MRILLPNHKILSAVADFIFRVLSIRYAASVFAIFMVANILFFVTDFLNGKILESEISRNQDLRETCFTIDSAGSVIKENNETAFGWNDMLHFSMNSEPISRDVKEVGIGGTDFYGTGELPPSNPALITEYKLDKSLRQLELLIEDTDYMEERLKVKLNGIAHMPYGNPTRGRILSGFGMRFHPILGFRRMHNGIDIKNRRGTPIQAAAAGICKRTVSDSFGKLVIINHGNGYKTIYAHLNKIAIKNNQRVKRGDIIGYMGSTGLSLGPHLHYEVRKHNRPRNPEDYILPEQYCVD
ncbi:MAG: M23 family metallopeptidase [Fibrobacterota bacterium]